MIVHDTRVKATSKLDLQLLERELPATIFAGRVKYLPETESTNSLAMDAANQAAPEGTLFIADMQTAGRGRGGNQWYAEQNSSLLFSFILRPRIKAADALWLSLLSGLAICDAVRQHTGLLPDLRWPNDLLLNKRKFCGILTELSSEGENLRHAVVGIGVNVNQEEFPPELRSTATSLRIEGKQEWSRTNLLAALLKRLDAEYMTMTAELTGNKPGQSLLQRLRSASSYVHGKHVHVGEAGGYEGTTAGLDERGFLLVQTATGIRRVISGGVRELR